MGSNAGRFIMGFIMFVGGLYLILNEIRVEPMFGYGRSLFHVGGVGVTSGYIMLIFMLGVGVLFFNGKNPLGWLLTAGSLVALIFGVIASVNFSLAYLSAFDLIVILVLLAGGLGLLLSSIVTRDR